MGEQADSFFVLIIMEASSDGRWKRNVRRADQLNVKWEGGKERGPCIPVFMFTQSPHVSSK